MTGRSKAILTALVVASTGLGGSQVEAARHQLPKIPKPQLIIRRAGTRLLIHYSIARGRGRAQVLQLTGRPVGSQPPPDSDEFTLKHMSGNTVMALPGGSLPYLVRAIAFGRGAAPSDVASVVVH
jgi:hypothetical protein